MPIYEIVYQSSATPVCGSGTSVTVHLVQDDVAMHPDAGSTSEFVDYVNVYYQPNETQDFVLHLMNTAYEAGKPEPTRVRVGRNDLCPCGSGRKWKRCCGWAGGKDATPELGE